MTLPIARSGADTVYPLDKSSLDKILQVAGNQFETLEYLQTMLNSTVGKNPDYAALLQEVNAIVDYTTAQYRAKLSPWSAVVGELKASFARTEFSDFQEYQAKKSVSKFKEDQSIIQDYAVSVEPGKPTQFVRAFTRTTIAPEQKVSPN